MRQRQRVQSLWDLLFFCSNFKLRDDSHGSQLEARPQEIQLMMSGFPKQISFFGVINDVGNFHDCQYLKYLPNIEFAWEHQAGFLGDLSRDESSRLGRSRKSINHQERIFRIFGLQARWQWVQDCWQGWIFTQIHSHKYAYTNTLTQIQIHKKIDCHYVC